MVTRTRVSVLAPALLAGLMVGITVNAAPPPNPKAQKLIAELEKASTLEAVAQAIRNANLSRAELDQLRPHLGSVEAKIERLVRQDAISRKPALDGARERELKLFEARNRQFIARQEQELEQGNAQARAALARARSASLPVKGTRPTLPTPAPPEITGTTPSALRAMQTFLIDGRHFGARQGRAMLQFRGGVRGPGTGDADIELQIVEWNDSYVYATLRWEAGARDSQAGRLIVTTAGGATAERSVEFIAQRVQYRLTRSLDRVHCEYWHPDDRPSAFCWAGEKRTDRFSWGRCPGGRVLSFGTTTLDSGGLGSGCRVMDRPSGVNWSGSVEIWADLFSWRVCEVWMEVEAYRGAECN